MEVVKEIEQLEMLVIKHKCFFVKFNLCFCYHMSSKILSSFFPSFAYLITREIYVKVNSG